MNRIELTESSLVIGARYNTKWQHKTTQKFKLIKVDSECAIIRAGSNSNPIKVPIDDLRLPLSPKALRITLKLIEEDPSRLIKP